MPRHPAIAKACHTLQHAVIAAAKPDREVATQWARLDACIRNGMPFAFEGDQRLLPEKAQHFNLLLHVFAARMEILVQGSILDFVPSITNPHSEAPTSGQHIQFSSLF